MNKIQEEKTIEQQRKEAFVEYVRTTNELKRERKKKQLIIVIIIVLVIVIIKIFFGTIELYNIFGASPSKARYYNVTVNNKQVAVSYISTHKIPIIPFLVNFNSVYLGSSLVDGNDDGSYYADDSKEYIIDVNSYSCYYQDIQTECKDNQQELKKNNDEEYSLLTITRITNPHEVVYQGNMTEDIAPFITKKGQYHVEITAKHGLVETKMYFNFENY